MRTPVVALDRGPLGLVTHPKGGADARECKDWLKSLLEDGCRVLVPAISDYELRRELLRGRKLEGLAPLDALLRAPDYLPLEQEVLNEAAEIWAKARNFGQPTAPDLALDGDCILAAQAWNVHILLFREKFVSEFDTVIATTNPRHLERFAPAMHRRDVPQWYKQRDEREE